MEILLPDASRFNRRCINGAVPIAGSDGSVWCINFPKELRYTVPDAHAPELQTSARVIFIASCDPSDWFTSWWSPLLANGAGEGALVVPGIVAMEALPANANIAVGDLGFTDLVQGIQGYQTFVNSLTKGETVEQAVTDANNKIAEIHPTLQVPPG